MQYTSEGIKRALAGNLRGLASHQRMMPPNRKLRAARDDEKRLKPSSVLLLLFSENEELIICLIKRPVTMKYHAGQVAFPGGRIEPGETAMETALRETHEEIGIKPERIEILGALSELFVDVSGFLIRPFVGWLKEKPRFSINEAEVEKIILFPLLKYRDALEETELETVSGVLRVPCFRFEGEIIWGATAMILSEFFDAMEDHLD
ncbi:CoA pyrophosphatase [Mariniphaga sediminis]|jgi:8-oxo-dGTP pyrophosphatase MutT (NUDIX family)|uniref:CoA pyrophosphatase n=1 Tax=Mariniphaga sediminis TaxID=1628158 RepID=A0A399CZ60_9BACT|nr:CoA pyrophosphatase [Mariniphaga sediminis]RIH63772.1 CoA pyrophosphatase [Mariniphaga sediminis]